MKQIAGVIGLVSLCLLISGCTTFRESRGYLNEDVANILTDVQTCFSNFGERTFFIKEIR